MQVQVQWKKLVKPLAPTPRYRKKLKLAPTNEIKVPFYVGTIFCYGDDAKNPGVDTLQKVNRREKSLSETLTLFYPMAGRYILAHARVNGQIDQLLHGDPDMDLIDRLSKFPTNVAGNPLVVIQVNTFECGGLVMGLRFTRKIGDVCTMAMLINSWAAACQGSTDSVVCPKFRVVNSAPDKRVGGSVTAFSTY
ncbi:hypothetical protein ACJRO7_027010 [Eucalyptus globulus]|uniref:Uncharacterized protein n=1 Tax=Eucalyptus globulus TaxID=34317 RepID=A0ABD3JTM3_EUCGL